MDKQSIIREYLREIGRKGGYTKSPARARASRRNAKLATAAVLAGKRKRRQLHLKLGT